MAIKFTINERTLAKGFGVPLVKRAIISANVNERLEEQNSGNSFEFDRVEGKSYLGTPLYGTMWLEEPKYNKFVFNKKTGEYEEKPSLFSPSNKTEGDRNYLYIENTIVEVSKSKNIVKTEISGQDGSIKEFINNGDYMITVRGFFSTNDADLYPSDEVRNLVEYTDAPIPLKVTNNYLNTFFSVYEMVVEKCTLNQVEGMRNVQYFTLECSSNTAFEIFEIDNV